MSDQESDLTLIKQLIELAETKGTKYSSFTNPYPSYIYHHRGITLEYMQGEILRDFSGSLIPVVNELKVYKRRVPFIPFFRVLILDFINIVYPEARQPIFWRECKFYEIRHIRKAWQKDMSKLFD